MGIFGKLTRHIDHVLTLDASNMLLPSRGVGNIIVKRAGDIAAAKAYFGDQIDLNIPILATPSALDSWAEAARGAEPDEFDELDELDSEADW